ncbi:hypothetical protein [Haliangium sp.]|uniref:hypothetical protein n=1 Tax=Haliangium sp. TaxID=2663208 RepID=UPI003D12C3AB
MIRRSLFIFLVGLALLLCACGRPKADDCKKAVANIRSLYKTAGLDYGLSPQAAIRSCRGNASRESVQCMIAAKTIEELDACQGDAVTSGDPQGGSDQERASQDESGGDDD